VQVDMLQAHFLLDFVILLMQLIFVEMPTDTVIEV
jgi:hypothetical protein